MQEIRVDLVDLLTKDAISNLLARLKRTTMDVFVHKFTLVNGMNLFIKSVEICIIAIKMVEHLLNVV